MAIHYARYETEYNQLGIKLAVLSSYRLLWHCFEKVQRKNISVIPLLLLRWQGGCISASVAAVDALQEKS